MEVQIVKWGNGQGIRIPKKMMESLGITVNDILDINVVDNKIVIEKKYRHRSLEQRAEAYGGTLGPYEEFDWGEPCGREVL